MTGDLMQPNDVNVHWLNKINISWLDIFAVLVEMNNNQNKAHIKHVMMNYA